MAWYNESVFYHIYPLGLCGSAQKNEGIAESHFDKLNEWAKHAKEIGCNAIYIGPLFQSEGHGYETTDYRLVDTRIGTNDDFKQFVKNCHDMGTHVIVDGVFNHVGRTFFAFQDLLANRENSRYKDWFCNVNFGGNNEYNDGFSYDNWGGYNLLVKLNLWNPEVKNYLFDAIRFWVSEFDIDGIRLDAADVLDMGFMHELRQVTDGLKADFWLMGEVIHGDYGRWANGDMLHSVTNYELHKGMFSGHNDHNYFEIAHTIKRLNGLCGKTQLYTFTDNHDVARIYSKLNNKEHMYPIALLQYTVPGIPSIYYGSEFGIEGDKQRDSDWNLRPCLSLDDYGDNYDKIELTKLFTRLGKIRQEYKELAYGDYRELVLTNRQFAIGRVLDGKAVITAVNNDDASVHMSIPLPVAAENAVNLLEVNEEEPKQETEADFSAHMDVAADLKSKLDAANEELGAIVRIYESGLDAKEEVSKLNQSIRLVNEQYDKLANTSNASQGTHNFDGEGKMQLSNGRLEVDLPANRGIIAYVY